MFNAFQAGLLAGNMECIFIDEIYFGCTRQQCLDFWEGLEAWHELDS